MSDFDRAFELVLGSEGGYVNDPRDPGGETKYGITKRDHPDVDIKNLSINGAKAIYLAKYWTPAKCGSLPWPLSAYVFDAAVNQGVVTALKLLQRGLGVPQDGILGNNTFMAIQKANQAELGALFLAERVLRYTGTRNFDIYGRGWLKRLFRLAAEAR